MKLNLYIAICIDSMPLLSISLVHNTRTLIHTKMTCMQAHTDTLYMCVLRTHVQSYIRGITWNKISIFIKNLNNLLVSIESYKYVLSA